MNSLVKSFYSAGYFSAHTRSRFSSRPINWYFFFHTIRPHVSWRLNYARTPCKLQPQLQQEGWVRRSLRLTVHNLQSIYFTIPCSRLEAVQPTRAVRRKAEDYAPVSVDVRRQAARVQGVVHPADEHRQDQELRRGRGCSPVQSGSWKNGYQQCRETGRCMLRVNCGFPGLRLARARARVAVMREF